MSALQTKVVCIRGRNHFSVAKDLYNLIVENIFLTLERQFSIINMRWTFVFKT